MHRPLYSLIMLLALMFLASCAGRDFRGAEVLPGNVPQQQGTFKVGNPYKVEGKWYQPQETYSYSETGIASWYGPGFDGKRTANGERFNKNELTGAHRTLQMPSLVRVTNLDNGRSVVVRINDRGPFKRSRIIDVSQKAADLLGFRGKGTAKVRLDLLADESRTIAMAAKQGQTTRGYEVALNGQAPQQASPYEQVSLAPDQGIPGHVRNGDFFPDPIVQHQPVHPTSIYIQAGSFGDATNAETLRQKLTPFGMAQIYPALVHGRQFYRVRVGPSPDVAHADELLGRMMAAGFKQAIIVVD